jgi:hypothetical protein
MKKLILKKYKVTQLNNLKSVNGGEYTQDAANGNETVGTVNDQTKDQTVIKLPTKQS